MVEMSDPRLVMSCFGSPKKRVVAWRTVGGVHFSNDGELRRGTKHPQNLFGL
jgi:hypothetical protein